MSTKLLCVLSFGYLVRPQSWQKLNATDKRDKQNPSQDEAVEDWLIKTEDHYSSGTLLFLNFLQIKEDKMGSFA